MAPSVVQGENKHFFRAGIIMRLVAVACFAAALPFTTAGQQIASDGDKDTLVLQPLFASPEAATLFLQHVLGRDQFRRLDAEGVLRPLISRLLDHYAEPFDSVRIRLDTLDMENWYHEEEITPMRDTLPIRWLNEFSFIIDTLHLTRDPFITKKTVVVKASDLSDIFPDSLSTDMKELIESLFQIRDTLIETIIDERYLRSRRVQLYRIADDMIHPPVMMPETDFSVTFLSDYTALVIEETEPVVAEPADPIGATLQDSLSQAMRLLLNHTRERDSVLLMVSGNDGKETPFWITTGRDDLVRYWVKNSRNDSITLWVGNPSARHIRLVLEEAVNVRRPEMLRIDHIPISTASPSRELVAIKALEEMPSSWKHSFVSSLSLNQNHLSNWAKGGASSFSSMLDLLARADYRNKKTRENWQSSGRLRYGTIRTKEHGFRSNTDIMEFNSQYNRVYLEKLDFSAVLYFKTQIAKGYKPPNDSVPISRFLNPGTFTVGIGAEYKPFKHTRINFSPLSYRTTFVLDTARINPITHGVESGKRTRQDFGGQVMIRNEMILLDDLKMTHAIRLFSSYLDKPQNIDVDWEMSLEKQINWYFTIRLNLHVIYDDDIKFPVLDDDGNPVLWPDGTPRRGPRTQLNQFLGLTLSFRL